MHCRQAWILLWVLVTGCDAPLDSVAFAVRTAFPQVPQRSVAWLVEQQARGNEILLLDVRTPEEFSVSHLQGARRAASLEEARVVLGDLPRDQPILVYCSVGYRSSQLADRLREEGYSDVANLEGSIFAWVNAGEPVVQADRRVHEVHPYAWPWGKLLDPQYRADPGR